MNLTYRAGGGMHRLIGTLFLMALAACGGEVATNVTADITGVWTLRTFNGKTLPAVFSQTPDTRVDVLDITLTFKTGGTFTRVGHLRTTADGQSTTDAISASGAYTVSGSDVSLTYSDGAGDAGSVSGSSLTITSGGAPFVYMK